VVKVDERKLNVVGDMTIRDVTKEVTIPLTKIFYENNRGRFKGTFEINRKDYGMTYNSMMNKIEDIVQVTVDISVREPGGGR
jgi:polyisoprenoid-binding protein YceI